jgi:hypothetical protein
MAGHWSKIKSFYPVFGEIGPQIPIAARLWGLAYYWSLYPESLTGHLNKFL